MFGVKLEPGSQVLAIALYRTNFLLALMASPVNGRLSIAFGDKLLQVGIKSIIGFTKQVHGCRR